MSQTSTVAAEAVRRPDGIAAVAGLLACPVCNGALALEGDALRCSGCGARYGLDDGIALLALRGTSGTWGTPQQNEQSDAYQAEYQTVERAAAYNHGYQRKVHKRIGTRHEWKIIRRHLDRVGHSRALGQTGAVGHASSNPGCWRDRARGGKNLDAAASTGIESRGNSG